MADMSNDRVLYLSIVTFIRTELDSSGFTGVGIVDDFPEDKLIVTSNTSTGADNEVILPAIALYDQTIQDGKRLGIGESEMWTYPAFTIFIHGETRGQEIDIRSMLRQSLHDKKASVYDYNNVDGYDIGDTSPTTLGTMEFLDVTSRAVRIQSENDALRNGGEISFRVETTRSSTNS